MHAEMAAEIGTDFQRSGSTDSKPQIVAFVH